MWFPGAAFDSFDPQLQNDNITSLFVADGSRPASNNVPIIQTQRHLIVGGKVKLSVFPFFLFNYLLKQKQTESQALCSFVPACFQWWWHSWKTENGAELLRSWRKQQPTFYIRKRRSVVLRWCFNLRTTRPLPINLLNIETFCMFLIGCNSPCFSFLMSASQEVYCCYSYVWFQFFSWELRFVEAAASGVCSRQTIVNRGNWSLDFGVLKSDWKQAAN